MAELSEDGLKRELREVSQSDGRTVRGWSEKRTEGGLSE